MHQTTERSAPSDNWDEHWSAHAGVNALNPAQAYRRKLIFELLALSGAKAPVRVLDLGSGSGELVSEIIRVRPDAEALGLDLSAGAVGIARRKVSGAAFVQQDFTKRLEVDGKYRLWATHAVCSEVLEHVDDPVAMIKNVRPLFAPGCKLVVTVPAGPMSAFDKHIGHRRHFDGRALRQTLQSAGLTVIDVRGAGFPFFNLYRLAVVARGEALVEHAIGSGASLPLTARAAIRAFGWLFRWNVGKTSLGWQLVATGLEPR